MTTPVDKTPIDLEVEEDEYEEYEEEYEDEPDYDDEEDVEDLERNVAYEYWSLPHNLTLTREAADFYLLYDMKLDGRDEGRFDDVCLPRLAKLFSNYTDMVVGGELRYTCSQVSNYMECLHPKLVYELRYTNLGGSQRHDAWEDWASVRRKYGTDALRWAEEAFLAFGSPATYGGQKWAHITSTLRKFEEGVYSPLVFVDMCWSTEHNGGQFFGKLWNPYALKTILDANQREDMNELLSYATTGVRKFYEGDE